MANSLADCRHVLRRYASADLGPPEQIGLQVCSGGFSGATVWRVGGERNAWALRRWPTPAIPHTRLRELHRWLQHVLSDGRLPVAVPQTASDGATFVTHDAATWQLEPWLPGEPVRSAPADARLASSMHSLAHLHLCSSRYFATPVGAEWFACRRGNSPAVAERLQLLASWTPERYAGALRRLSRGEITPLQNAAVRIELSAERCTPAVRRELTAVADIVVPLQPCLRDVWREHVLFTGDDVTGIIDASVARSETVAADLSRWLGSVLGREPHRRRQALAAYQTVRPLSDGELRLLPVLDRSNIVLSGLFWVDRLSREAIADPNGRLTMRLLEIAARLEETTGAPW